MNAQTSVFATATFIASGILHAQAQPAAPALSYDAAAIHKSPPGSEHRPGAGIGPGPQGGLRTHDTPVLMLISEAYEVQAFQVVGAPAWASTQAYDITFTPGKAEAAPETTTSSKSNLTDASIDRDLIRLRAILRDRFGLVLRSETREMPVYNLVRAKGGAKLTPASPTETNSNVRARGGQIIGVNTTIERLTAVLSSLLERPVHDETHLSGRYDFKAVTEPDASMSESLFTALQEQLGLKLESAKGPVQVYVVEKLNQPTEN
ncbi:MAG TPA: TIGR03435 family protein [Bryobacteraceae bacterium]|nr:TIGR03435 family protein [Bryobacteraceae bacterium]